MFIAAQFTIAKYWKQPKFPSANEWIQKLWYIYTMEFYAAEQIYFWMSQLLFIEGLLCSKHTAKSIIVFILALQAEKLTYQKH